MEVPMRKCACMFVCIFAASMASLRPASASGAACHPREFKTFLHDLNSQCPFSTTLCSSAIQVDGELLESVISSSQKNVYTAVLYYASWCPFSSTFLSKFSTLSSMYPQIKHLMIEQSSAVPSVFSRYGIHSVPSLLIINQNTRWKYHGRRDLMSLVSFYKRATGLDPVVDMFEDNSCGPASDQKIFNPWNGGSLTEIIWRELYLVLSVLFVLSRAIFYFFPAIVSRFTEIWFACIPHLNLGIFGESRQLIGRLFYLIDVKRVWSKLKVCKTRNFHEGARNARVWASSLASVSLGETSATRIFPSRDL
ncbi:5'-adenylylsulfate reductase-like 5-like [Dorcoceras hygrometricum]|uniref:5'-adenylylsulfate reductase-like 5-like n=1 Tax=Dorcoceras hygrometricum TaxID=472368 RepID=A0A2Z7CJK2_9LAMI|nr:5'-adenylylsulfate reductase-like 5-like [Dorcoceras hygrometricum]